MFPYHRDDFAAPAVQRILRRASETDRNETSLAAVCRHLGRVIIGWLLAIIVIETAVRYWGGTL